MADELLRSKHAVGSSDGISKAVEDGKIDAYDILFLDGDTDKPKIGWIDKNGNPVILTDEKADLSQVEADVDALESDVDALETELAKKADTETVNAELDELNSGVAGLVADMAACENTHLKVKYEITDVPVGTLVKYLSNEIRIMCPVGTEFTKQSVGAGGDSNNYYMTFKTYAPDNAVGYIEHLGGQVDAEILNDLKTDKYGRKYQPTWLSMARYDESSNTWNYYGKNSSLERYIGWDYQIDWYDADGIMIASDNIRINLSNEDCHYTNEPYYIANANAEVNTKIAEIMEAMTVAEF